MLVLFYCSHIPYRHETTTMYRKKLYQHEREVFILFISFQSILLLLIRPHFNKCAFKAMNEDGKKRNEQDEAKENCVNKKKNCVFEGSYGK